MRHIRPTFPSEFFVVADLSELHHGMICLTREDVEDSIYKASLRGEKCSVLRVGLDELGRDVSFEFEPESTDEWAGTSYDRAASAADAINDIRRDLRDILEGAL